jgi:RHS repeat-associated protein
LADFNQNFGGSWAKSSGSFGIDFSVTMGDGLTPSSAYDANGNILAMKQKGLLLNASTTIDELTYRYQSNSNKLQNVIDGANNPTTTLGDFRTSASSPNFSNLQNSRIDYSYDVNGNLQKDLNKDIGTAATGGIVYNHLNLPYQITVQQKGLITYIYDAAGNKLEKRTLDQTSNKTINTDYLSGFVYTDNTLQFFGHEQGRVRFKPASAVGQQASFNYDYFIKDHLGNTRVVLTDEQQQDVYPAATLEDGAVATENLYYTINTGAIVPNPVSLPTTYQNNNGNPPYNTNPTSNTTATSTKMYRLNAATGDKTGLGITIKVMAGDVVNMLGKSFWHNNGAVINNNNPIAVNDLLTLLAGSSAVSGSGKSITANALTSSPFIPQDLSNWLKNAPAAGLGPKSYLNWVLFDEQFRPVTTGSNSGFKSVGSAETINPITGVANISVSGYLYVYCSNESNVDVFFDNIQLIHTRGPLLEETHYYPFGLAMSGISSKAAGKLENRYKYNSGTELNTNLDLNWYETDFRSYDPQIGRFWQIDELTEFDLGWSPYVYAHDNPILYNDPLGLTASKSDSTNAPGFENTKGGVQNDLGNITVTSSPKKSVGQPGTAESLIPIWGSTRAAVDDFQNGRWGWGIFNSTMAVTDVFLVKSAITAIGKLVVKEAIAKEGVYVLTTRSGRYIGQSKNFLKRIIQHFGKGGKLSGDALEKALLHEMPGSTKLEREVYEQYLIDNNGLDNLINVVNPMGGRREMFGQMVDGVIQKFGLPK